MYLIINISLILYNTILAVKRNKKNRQNKSYLDYNINLFINFTCILEF